MKPIIHSFILTALLSGASALRARELPVWKLDCASGAAMVKSAGGAEMLRYFATKPEGTAFSANSTCCFHPFTTPAGHAVTAFAPDDHKHHRGLFLGWVELHGAADADFWGWGAHAPVKDYVIIGRSLTPLAAKDGAVSFVAANDWMAGEVTVLNETLTAIAHQQGGAALHHPRRAPGVIALPPPLRTTQADVVKTSA